jgi:hypothetical protein
MANRHTSPFGLHPEGLLHTPTVAPAAMLQVTIDPPPQQSLSWVQRSPATWQPVAGWQTLTPVGP